MFYMPRKCTVIRLCLELASAMSFVGCALPSLHLSPMLCLPCQWPSHGTFPRALSQMGRDFLAHERDLWGAVIGRLPGLHLGNAQLQVYITANPEMLPVPTAPGFKAHLDLHPRILHGSGRAV